MTYITTYFTFSSFYQIYDGQSLICNHYGYLITKCMKKAMPRKKIDKPHPM